MKRIKKMNNNDMNCIIGDYGFDNAINNYKKITKYWIILI